MFGLRRRIQDCVSRIEKVAQKKSFLRKFKSFNPFHLLLVPNDWEYSKEGKWWMKTEEESNKDNDTRFKVRDQFLTSMSSCSKTKSSHHIVRPKEVGNRMSCEKVI